MEVTMASVREYLENLETGQLENFLSREVFGWGYNPLSSMYLMCQILSERDPARGTAKDIFLEFAVHYADNKLLTDQES